MALLSNSPRIRKQPPGFVLTTSLWWKILLVGLSLRKVSIDLGAKEIRVTSRYLWLLVFPKTFQFSEIRAVTYGYEDLATQTIFDNEHDSYDSFSVGLQFHNEQEFVLFKFSGEGTTTYDSPWIPWASNRKPLFDLVGTQESDSREFAELLANLLNVKIVRPRY